MNLCPKCGKVIVKENKSASVLDFCSCGYNPMNEQDREMTLPSREKIADCREAIRNTHR